MSEKIPYAIERFMNESKRILRLHFPDLSHWPHAQRWFEQVGAPRPAVKKGLAIPELKA